MRSGRHNPLRGSDIRERNEKIILSLISRKGRLSQSEVVAMTGLKPPTVLRIFAKLVESGMIRVSSIQDRDPERKGRRPVFYELVPDCAYVIGVDFWAQNASIVIVDFANNPVYTSRLHFKRDLDAGQVVKELIELIRSSVERSGLDGDDIIGIGIGAPGRIDTATGTVIYYARIPGMVEYPLSEEIKAEFDYPVLVNNNTNVIALNAWNRGESRGLRSYITILIRSGVGGAYLQEGHLLQNGRQTVLELGHLSVERIAGENGCGDSCCLEDRIAEGTLLEETSELFGIESIEELDSAIEKDDPKLLSFLDTKARILSYICSDLYHIFNPEGMLLISRSRALSRFLASRLDVHFHDVCDLPQSVSKLTFLGDVYDPTQACIGASRLIFDAFFTSSLTGVETIVQQ